MIHEFGFGTEKQQIEIPEKNLYRELLANDNIAFSPEDADIRYSLEHPVNSKRLKDIIKPGEKIAIITSDITRPMPTYKVMPELLAELRGARILKISRLYLLLEATESKRKKKKRNLQESLLTNESTL